MRAAKKWNYPHGFKVPQTRVKTNFIHSNKNILKSNRKSAQIQFLSILIYPRKKGGKKKRSILKLKVDTSAIIGLKLADFPGYLLVNPLIRVIPMNAEVRQGGQDRSQRHCLRSPV